MGFIFTLSTSHFSPTAIPVSFDKSHVGNFVPTFPPGHLLLVPLVLKTQMKDTKNSSRSSRGGFFRSMGREFAYSK